jgi:hypothetical protein
VKKLFTALIMLAFLLSAGNAAAATGTGHLGEHVSSSHQSSVRAERMTT